MVLKEEVVENYHEHWKVHLLETFSVAPGYWCFSCWCPCWAMYSQRKRINPEFPDNYLCCNGLYCGECSWLGGPGLCQKCPRTCLVTESIFCCWCAIFANRATLQHRYEIRNTKLEECMIWTACICSWAILILSFIFPIPDAAECCIDCAYASFAACLQTQQELELDHRLEGHGHDGKKHHDEI